MLSVLLPLLLLFLLVYYLVFVLIYCCAFHLFVLLIIRIWLANKLYLILFFTVGFAPCDYLGKSILSFPSTFFHRSSEFKRARTHALTLALECLHYVGHNSNFCIYSQLSLIYAAVLSLFSPHNLCCIAYLCGLDTCIAYLCSVGGSSQ